MDIKSEIECQINLLRDVAKDNIVLAFEYSLIKIQSLENLTIIYQNLHEESLSCTQRFEIKINEIRDLCKTNTDINPQEILAVLQKV